MSEWTETESAGSGGGTTVSSTEPSNPSRGDEWVDDSYRKPAKKVYMGDGKWATLVPGSNVPGEQTYTSNNVVDVSNINETVQIELVATEGESAKWESGAGGAGIVEVDLTSYNEIKVRPGSLKGDAPSGPDQHSKYNYSPGAGGNGTAILDGSGNTIAVAGGGGGSGDYDTTYDDGYSWIEGSNGGDGGPTGSRASGDGSKFEVFWPNDGGQDIQNKTPATDGQLISKQESATVISQTISRDQASVTMFK